MEVSLKGKTALVCGSSQGIGEAIAKEYASSGANVVLMARNKDKLTQVRDSLFCDGQSHSIISVDFAEPESVLKSVEKYLQDGNNIDILVNNTGGPAPGELNSAEVVDLEQEFKKHILVSQLLVKSVLPGMKQNGYGRILNIISVGLKQPIANLGVSNTIRGAMGSWGKTLSKELAPFGITVNNLLPGYTMTERLKSLFEFRAERSGLTAQEVQRNIESSVPAGRIGDPQELAFAATFLASENASYINGVSLPVDGGFLSCI